jgi:hypothetical protein
MLYRKIIAVCSEIHTKYINTICGQLKARETPHENSGAGADADRINLSLL